MEVDVFRQGIDALITDLKASRRNEDTPVIYMPGELEFLRKEENVQIGVEISSAVLEDLLAVQRKYGTKNQIEAVLIEK